jgi:Bifunctional DNA primase/polymerase, N-terminal
MNVAGNGHSRKIRRTGVRVRPFAEAAAYYRRIGWPGELPVSRKGTKAPLYAGITGHSGKDAEPGLLRALVSEYGWANIGLRLPLPFVGIDVDDYDGHNGAATLAALEQKLGPLPVTWKTTSREPEDPVSGIYLFFAPRSAEQKWVTDLGTGSGIEIVQQHHRFITVAPSLHNSTGRQYCWYYGDGELVSPPSPDELPLLPIRWARYLLSARAYKAGAIATDREVAKWYDRVHGGSMCTAMEAAAELEAARMRDAAKTGGLHARLLPATSHLCANAAEGCTGLGRALRIVETEFLRASRKRSLQAEWQSAVKSAMSRAAALPQADMDVCSARGAQPKVAR